MTEPIEEYLRTQMRQQVDTIVVEDTFTSLLLDGARGGGRRRRARRRFGWALVAVSSAAAVTVSLILALGGQTSPRPSDGIAANGSNGPSSAMAWAMRLPAGAPSALAYISGGFLHAGEQTIPVPGREWEVIGRTVGGWLIFVGHLDEHGLPTRSSYGVLTPTGEYQQLPGDGYRGSAQVQALSPSGRLFATGGTVLDVASSGVIARVPKAAQYANLWGTQGLIYLDRGNRPFQWIPGHRPVPLESDIVSVATHSAAAVTAASGGCASLVQIAPNGSFHQLYRGCGTRTPLSVSPDGHLAVTSRLHLVDAATGAITDPLNLPATVAAGWNRDVWWEGNNTVLFPLFGQALSRDDQGQIDGPRSAVLVRCTVTTGTCQRAGTRLQLSPSEDLQLR